MTRHGVLLGAVLCLAASAELTRADDLGAQATRILEAYRKTDPQPANKKLLIVCWRSRDTEFPADHRARLRGMMEHIRNFYADEMERSGLGRRTFQLEYDAQGELVVHETVGEKTAKEYDQKTGGWPIRTECWKSLHDAGLNPDRETVVIFTNLADWDPEKLTFSHHSPYQGLGDFRQGIAWQLDHAGLAVSNLTTKTPVIQDREYGRISLGKHNSIFIGGIAHELGHALGLPHCRESAEEFRTRGTALMGSGNRTYGDQLRGEGRGSFLSMDSALRLAAHPLFTGSAKGLELEATAQFSGLSVVADTNAFILSGQVTGSVPVHAVVAYLDPAGGDDYDARTACTVPHPDGTFSLRCSELVAGKPAALRLCAYMANGAVDRENFEYNVSRDGKPNVTAMQMSLKLAPFLAAFNTNSTQAVALCSALPAGSAEHRLASSLIAARNPRTNLPVARNVAADVRSIPLSHVAADEAKVGWWKPVYDVLPRPDALLAAGGELFETGIFAHAPARHRYELAGGWTRLQGHCGLARGSHGSVVFVIRTDGREIWRTGKIEPLQTKTFDLDLTGMKSLELLTEDAGNGNANDWALWLDTVLKR